MNTPVKEQAQRLLETLPEDATWEDLQYAIYIHQAVEAGQADIDAGRVYTSEEVRQKFKLPPRA
jgi:predicted transcriptional regulator